MDAMIKTCPPRRRGISVTTIIISSSEKPARRRPPLSSCGHVARWGDELSMASYLQGGFVRAAVARRVAQRYPSADGFLCGCSRWHIGVGALMTMELSNIKSRRGGQMTPTSALPATSRGARARQGGQTGVAGPGPRPSQREAIFRLRKGLSAASIPGNHSLSGRSIGE